MKITCKHCQKKNLHSGRGIAVLLSFFSAMFISGFLIAGIYWCFFKTPKIGGPVFRAELPGKIMLEMVKINAGKFLMGSPEEEIDRDKDEIQHRVELTQDFYIGKFELTNAQWQAVMGNIPSFWKEKRNPVTNITWHEAMAFCKKLNEMEIAPSGWEFTLPTEAQWEYVCRAGTETVFSFGKTLNGKDANCNGKEPYGTEKNGKYLGRTGNVGSYNPNPWGVFDMHGNVAEWCLDWAGSYDLNTTIDPSGLPVGYYRIIRGGSWKHGAKHCRSAYRDLRDPNVKEYHAGMRVVLVRKK